MLYNDYPRATKSNVKLADVREMSDYGQRRNHITGDHIGWTDAVFIASYDDVQLFHVFLTHLQDLCGVVLVFLFAQRHSLDFQLNDSAFLTHSENRRAPFLWLIHTCDVSSVG
jgi:hypothetical protein